MDSIIGVTALRFLHLERRSAAWLHAGKGKCCIWVLNEVNLYFKDRFYWLQMIQFNLNVPSVPSVTVSILFSGALPTHDMLKAHAQEFPVLSLDGSIVGKLSQAFRYEVRRPLMKYGSENPFSLLSFVWFLNKYLQSHVTKLIMGSVYKVKSIISVTTLDKLCFFLNFNRYNEKWNVDRLLAIASANYEILSVTSRIDCSFIDGPTS